MSTLSVRVAFIEHRARFLAMPYADGIKRGRAVRQWCVAQILAAQQDEPNQHCGRSADRASRSGTGEPQSVAGISSGAGIHIVAGQLDQVAPDASASNPDLIAGVEDQPSGVSGNVTLSSVKYTLAFREYGPPANDDGHFVAFDVKSTNADVARFLSAAVSDSAPPPIGQ